MKKSDVESYYQFTLLLLQRAQAISHKNDIKTDRLLFMSRAYAACRDAGLTRSEMRRLYAHCYGGSVSVELIDKVIRAEIRQFNAAKRRCAVSGKTAMSFRPRAISTGSRRRDPMRDCCERLS